MSDTPDQDIVLFTEALRLRSAARSDYLNVACAGDDAGRQRIEALLKAFEKADDFLAEPAADISTEDIPAMIIGESVGDRIGRYKLLQQIGEGGCGVVFMAEQAEPVRRRVALKIIKPGMDTKNVIARFEAERQAVALMDHPNIAQVFDAGATKNGRPYFVMELIRGLKITDYCDQNSLTTRARLDLFMQVCGAIQHAHQKGIIHRDIKPSNILVPTTDDGKALAKVIDFGIAKATTGQRLTDKTLFTAFELLIGTPNYMSPEQATLTSVDIDTRSDIYSLGVLLYELLTGTTPFDATELLKVGLDEVRRVIREREPARPSTRLSTMLAADLTKVSRHRGAEALNLISDVRGDLDWIVLKAMEKDRVRRYPTAHDLAMEIERFLNGDVVLARPSSAVYRLQKLFSRNKLLFSSVAIIFVLLVISLLITSRLLMVERKTQERMKHQADVLRLESLAMSQLVQSKLPESESSFKQSFSIRKQFLGDEPPNAIVVATFILLLDKEKKETEADAFLAASLKPDLIYVPAYGGFFMRQINELAEQGQWGAASVRAAYLLKAEPGLSARYHALAPLLVAQGDIPGYRQLCQQIVSRFKNTDDFYIADQMAKDCLILPASGVDLKQVAQWADLTIARGKDSGSYSFFECCKALAEYRQGHFTESITWAGSAVKYPMPYSQAEGYAILAMAQFRLGQIEDAHAALAHCEKMIAEKLPRLESGDLGVNWRDWIIIHALRDEAQSLISGKDALVGNWQQK